MPAVIWAREVNALDSMSSDTPAYAYSQPAAAADARRARSRRTTCPPATTDTSGEGGASEAAAGGGAESGEGAAAGVGGGAGEAPGCVSWFDLQSRLIDSFPNLLLNPHSRNKVAATCCHCCLPTRATRLRLLLPIALGCGFCC